MPPKSHEHRDPHDSSASNQGRATTKKALLYQSIEAGLLLNQADNPLDFLERAFTCLNRLIPEISEARLQIIPQPDSPSNTPWKAWQWSISQSDHKIDAPQTNSILSHSLALDSRATLDLQVTPIASKRHASLRLEKGVKLLAPRLQIYWPNTSRAETEQLKALQLAAGIAAPIYYQFLIEQGTPRLLGYGPSNQSDALHQSLLPIVQKEATRLLRHWQRQTPSSTSRHYQGQLNHLGNQLAFHAYAAEDSRTLTSFINAHPLPADAINPLFTNLTPRERQIATAVHCGKSNPAIAKELGISRRTIEAHVATILAKLHLESRRQLQAN